MMDLTQLFHASVKTARIRSKALGLDKDQAKNIFPREKRICEFSKRAKGLVSFLGALSFYMSTVYTQYLGDYRLFAKSLVVYLLITSNKIVNDIHKAVVLQLILIFYLISCQILQRCASIISVKNYHIN